MAQADEINRATALARLLLTEHLRREQRGRRFRRWANVVTNVLAQWSTVANYSKRHPSVDDLLAFCDAMANLPEQHRNLSAVFADIRNALRQTASISPAFFSLVKRAIRAYLLAPQEFGVEAPPPKGRALQGSRRRNLRGGV